MLASFFSLVVGVLAAGQEPAAASEAVHRVSIDVLGPVAQVQVERSVGIGEQGTKSETVFDLDLPEGAALVDWGAEVAGRTLKLTPVSAAKGRASLAATLSAQHLKPASASSDDAATRVHLVPLAGPAKVNLRYRYAAPLGCVDGRLVLRVPASMDAEPIPAQVTVQFRLPPASKLAEATVAGVPVRLGKNGRAPLVRETAPRRAAWEVTFALRGASGPFGNLSVARAAGNSSSALAVAMCRAQRTPDIELPGELLLLIDGSRSVGAGGMSNQRDLARALVEALPPAERFNAFVFARTVTQAFPLPRSATREALDSLMAAADPNRLENGTDLSAALERVATWIKGDPSKGPRLLAIITDGAIPEAQSVEKLAATLGQVGDRLRLLLLMVRPAADDRVPGEVVSRLNRFAGRFGGVVRVLTAENTREVARSLVAALGQGGDLFNLRVAGGEGPLLADNVGPGHGFSKVVSGVRGARVHLMGEYQGAAVRANPAAATSGKEWLFPLREQRKGQAWSGQSREAAFFVEEMQAQAKPAADGVVRGQMDPMVLRNALSLAFLPRARACYLARRVGNGTDLNLRGRVRLELHLERGELEDAVIGGASTLNRPEIERCVREAAFAIEYPRPMFRDAPTVAALNLVFRPRTPPEEARPDASEFDRQIDLILGPVSFDPKKLLEEEAEAESKDARRKASVE
jgi:hypothetical protein